MKETENKLNVIPMSKETRRKLSKIMNETKGKDLFPEKTELAQKTLQDVTSLPR